MAIKSANVSARVEPEIKEKAEEILEHLGIPVSVGINMFYRQVIYWNGLPFRPALPDHKPAAVSEMTKEEFDARMAEGLAQAKADDSAPVDEVISRLIGEIANG
jgi:DNA-damage-inducible protein J